MSSSVDYFWDNCPQWLFQWFIGGSFYVIVSVWSLTEFLRIIVKLSKFQTQKLLNQNNNNSNKSKQNISKDSDFNRSYNFTFPVNKQMGGNSNDNNDTRTESKNSSNISTNYGSYSSKKYAKTDHDPKKENKVNIFGSRASQKAFLIVIFFQSLFRSIECLSIAFIKKITSSKHTNCSMRVVDSIAGSNSVWYIYCESLGALLFPMAFSCLAYQLAKIYYRFNYESSSLKYVEQSIYAFLYGLISLNIVCFVGIFVLLFWIQFGDDTASHSSLETYMAILYGVMCIILAICYARFAFPIYRIYTRIMVIINHKKTTNKESVGAGNSLNSPLISEDHTDLIYENAELDENVDTDGSLLYSDYCDIYQWETRKKRYCCKCCHYDRSDNMECTFTDYSKITKVKMPTDAQMFYAQFIASMKRTWITALFCGIAFLLRAIFLLIPPVTSWYENKVYIHAIYFLFLEILPIFAMLYIYGNATKSIVSQRFFDQLLLTCLEQMSQTDGGCGHCGNTGNTKKCSGCKQVWYCNGNCQKKHWKKHKKECKIWRKKDGNQLKLSNNEKETKCKRKKSFHGHLLWQCQICGFHNNVKTKDCMVCDQLGVKITAKNSRPEDI